MKNHSDAETRMQYLLLLLFIQLENAIPPKVRIPQSLLPPGLVIFLSLGGQYMYM